MGTFSDHVVRVAIPMIESGRGAFFVVGVGKVRETRPQVRCDLCPQVVLPFDVLVEEV